MSRDEEPLLIEPVVNRPREAQEGRSYLVSVDLWGPLGPDGGYDGGVWHYPEEEFTFTVLLDGSPHFVCEVLDEPSVVLHRFGGTYGPARFVVTAGRAAESAALWLTVSNQWGVPVRKVELPCAIEELRSARSPELQVVGYLPTGPGEGPENSGTPGAERYDAQGTPPDETAEQGPGPGPTRTRARPQRTGPHRSPPVRDLPSERGPGPEPVSGPDILVVHAGFDQVWAEWIADRLGGRGLSVALRRWDPAGDVPLERYLRDPAPTARTVLLVLSEALLQRPVYEAEEWQALLAAPLPGGRPHFAAVSLTASLPPVLAALAPVQLAGLSAEEAEEALLGRLGVETTAPPEPLGSGQGSRYPGEPVAVWGGVPGLNPRFTGRGELLDAVHQSLSDGPGSSVVSLVGTSGVGKTQLAAEYAHRFGSEYDVVWWVPADGRAICRQRLAELSPALGLNTGAEYGERLRAVRHALRYGRPYARWLVIFDSADDPPQVRDLVPSGPGHVLITTRNRAWADFCTGTVEVPVYHREESVAFVRSRAPRLLPAEADRLAETLEDLPLLLDQAAGWLNDSDVSVREYAELVRSGLGGEVLRTSADFPLTFQSAWSIMLRQLQRISPASLDLLRLCSCFAPGYLSLGLLRRSPPDRLPRRLAQLISEPLLWDLAVGKLVQYSVIRLEGETPGPQGDDGPSPYLAMHRMVHQFVRGSMSREERDSFKEAARRILVAGEPSTPTETAMWPYYADITPHLRWTDVLASSERREHDLVLNCLQYMYLSGEYGEGIRLADEAMPLWRALLGETHARVWDLSHHHANLLRETGDYVASEAMDRAATGHLLTDAGPRDMRYLRAAGGLAADLRGLGRYGEALELSQSLVVLHRESAGEDDVGTLNAQNNLAVSLRLLGRYTEALQLDIRTMRIRQRFHGERHRWSLYSGIHRASDLRLLGRYREAELLQEHNLRVHQEVLGPDHPQTLRAGQNLALCRYLAGERQSARPLFGQVLERCERVLGESSPVTLMTATTWAWVEREGGDPESALARQRDVEHRYRAMLGPEHPFTVGARGNLGLTLLRLEEWHEGRDEVERACTAMTAAVGPEHPWTLACALNTAMARSLTGDVERAVDLGREAGGLATRTLGDRHPLTLACRTGLAADLRALGRAREAEQFQAQTVEALRATLGAGHPVTVEAGDWVRVHWDFEPQII